MKTEEFKQYLYGFFDGDGSISVEKQKSGFALRIKFFQSNLDWINKIQLYYPFFKRILTDQEIDFINSLKANDKKISTIKTAQIILEKYGKKISTGFIGDIWKGKLLPMYKMRENFYNDKDIFP